MTDLDPDALKAAIEAYRQSICVRDDTDEHDIENAIRAYLIAVAETPRAKAERERLRAVVEAARSVQLAVDCMETARTVKQEREFTAEIITEAQKLADCIAALDASDE